MKCRSGKHEWRDPVSASRCCDPDWSRELRYGSERMPGDADDGVQVISGGGGMCWVWHYLPESEEEKPDDEAISRILAAAQAIARMRAPSVAQILRRRGFGFEADRIEDLIRAVDAAFPPKGAT